MHIPLKRLLLIVLSFMILVVNRVNGQETTSAKALKYFDKAQAYYEIGEWQACRDELDKAIRADSTFSDAYIMLGDVYQEDKNLAMAAEQYRKALQFHPEKEDIVLSLLANTLFSLEQYQEACEYYSKIIDYQGISVELRTSASKNLAIARARMIMMENPVSFSPVNLGPTVNSPADEYINALSADGNGIYFTRRMKSSAGTTRDFVEDFYYALLSGDSLKNASLLEYPPGKENDAGAICISPDGRFLFFTACFRPDSFGSCDLYYSEKTGDTWSEARNMGSYINTEFWDAQPSVSPDGRALYFSSNRPGGRGSSDIWRTERETDGSWKKPVNLGTPVNTTGPEMGPFIHYDNQTLYFSSGGHPGMGGADLFKSSRINDCWSEPENLGYPINSLADELVVVINAAGDQGYISSNALEGKGGYDIYKFELDASIRPVPVSYLQGKVIDASNAQPLEAKFELIDIEQDSLIISAVSDRQNGEFLVCLPLNHNFALNVSCEGYLFYSEHFPFSEIKSIIDPLKKDILLEPVLKGKKMVLRNIFFNTDEYRLEPESYAELNKLSDFLQENPLLKIEIGGHTDNQGDVEYNSELSLKRAKAVYDYLIERGCNAGKMTYKGYGETKPEGTNDTEEGRAINRRTEITIMESR